MFTRNALTSPSTLLPLSLRLPLPVLLAGAAALAATACASIATAQEGPGLGVPATAEQIAGWDRSVAPDGATLPPGAGTANAGKALYEQKCLACHGPEGAGMPNDQLVGGHGTLKTAAAVKTIGSYWPYATTVFDYIRRAMPFVAPQSLSNDEVYSLTAYLLFLNGVIKEGDTMNGQTLPAVVMPNRENFIVMYPAQDPQ